MENFKPSKSDLEDAIHKTVPDIIAPNLKILFCGINPGLYTAAVGHHFGRPGNRFWKALYEGGLTPRLFHPSEQNELLKLGLGITNLFPKTTRRADELSRSELNQGALTLERKVKKYQPLWVCILGIEAYKKAFNRPLSKPGLQKEKIANTKIWLMGNPSGLNAHYNAQSFAKSFKELKKLVGE